MEFVPFRQQAEFLMSDERIRCLFAGKRSGKSEVCYIDLIMHLDNRPGHDTDSRDPYMAAMILPTDQMLKKLAWPKFFQFAKPAGASLNDFNKTENRLYWPNGSVLYGISAEKIQRMEGLKLNYILIDEALQVSEHVFYESLARLSDSRGKLVVSGSLGTNIINPKRHWVYKTFKEDSFGEADIWEWRTLDNPYFPKEELNRLRDQLDPRTYRQLFEIDWAGSGDALVFPDFNEGNIVQGDLYDERLPVSIAVDWGFTHPACVLFCQYDPRTKTVHIIDEIFQSKMMLDELYARIKAKPYQIKEYFCDAAGTQTREATGLSNIAWFAKPPRNIHFKYRRASIVDGITLVRSWVQNGLGQKRLLVSTRCKNLIDEMRTYSYQVKNGEIVGEVPIQEGEDAISALRYYMLNKHDDRRGQSKMLSANRFGEWKFR